MPDEKKDKKDELEKEEERHITASFNRMANILDLLREEGLISKETTISDDIIVLSTFLCMMTIRLDAIYDQGVEQPPEDDWKKDST